VTESGTILDLREALAALRTARRPTDVIVSTMGAAREWMALGPLHPLDFVLVPSAMGHGTSLGLGLALAQPARRVIVLNGDGSMLMNLGSLVTITAAAPRNLVVVVCDNRAYEVTGAQPTPASPAGRSQGDAVDWPGLARSAGFRSVFRFRSRDEWNRGMVAALGAEGPVFVQLEVAAVAGIGGPRSPGPAADRARRFMEAVRS
jgi:thiamine pyrophosphate-dependent acetolactate synthase large subunit-like protein